MSVATQQHVRDAIRSTGAAGTVAEVLAIITAKSIEKTDTTRKVYSDVATRLNRLGLPGNSIVDAIRDDLLANGPKWVCDQLGGSGIDFAHDDLQSQLDTMRTATPPRLTPQLAAILKSIGRWMESSLEQFAGLGATTDEATVQAVLDTLAAEAAADAERQAQAATLQARTDLERQVRTWLDSQFNRALAAMDSGATTFEDLVPVLTSLEE